MDDFVDVDAAAIGPDPWRTSQSAADLLIGIGDSGRPHETVLSSQGFPCRSVCLGRWPRATPMERRSLASARDRAAFVIDKRQVVLGGRGCRGPWAFLHAVLGLGALGQQFWRGLAHRSRTRPLRAGADLLLEPLPERGGLAQILRGHARNSG